MYHSPGSIIYADSCQAPTTGLVSTQQRRSAMFQLSDARPLQGTQPCPGIEVSGSKHCHLCQLRGTSRDPQSELWISLPPAISCPQQCPSDTCLGVSRVPETDPFIPISSTPDFSFFSSQSLCVINIAQD